MSNKTVPTKYILAERKLHSLIWQKGYDAHTQYIYNLQAAAALGEPLPSPPANPFTLSESLNNPVKKHI